MIHLLLKFPNGRIEWVKFAPGFKLHSITASYGRNTIILASKEDTNE